MDRKPGWLVWSQEEGHRVHLDGQPQGMLLYREKAVQGKGCVVQSGNDFDGKSCVIGRDDERMG